MKWMYRSIVFVFVGLSIFGSVRAYYWLTDGFSLANISSPLIYQEEWDVSSQESLSDEQIREILSQNFTYLGKGCQSYVFESGDGEHVLKFFKFQHLRTQTFWDNAPLPGFLAKKRTEARNRHEKKLQRLFTGCKVAYTTIPAQSGVEYIHLNPTDSLNCKIKIVDKLGILRQVSADASAFIVQKRAVPAIEHLGKLVKGGNAEAVSAAFKNILQLYRSRAQLGVDDLDPATVQNIGFVGEKALILDVGQLALAKESSQNKEITKRTVNIRSWLLSHEPRLVQPFDEACKQFAQEHVDDS